MLSVEHMDGAPPIRRPNPGEWHMQLRAFPVELLNELRNAGAEAISVEEVRVVPGTVVFGEPGSLSVENTPLSESFEIRAIGSPPILNGTLTRGGGVIAQLGATYEGVEISVTPLETVAIPASERDLVPSHGTPSL